MNKDNHLKSSNNIISDNYMKMFKFYNLVMIVSIAYLSLVINKHGGFYLVFYFLLTSPFIILNTTTLEQLQNKPTANVDFLMRPIYSKLFKVFSVDYYTINNIPNFVLKEILEKKLYMFCVAPFIVLTSINIHSF